MSTRSSIRSRRAFGRALAVGVGMATLPLAAAVAFTGTVGGASTSLPLGLKPGTYHATFTWRNSHGGAAFRGRIGPASYSGRSVEPGRYQPTFRVTGSVGRQPFHLLLTMGAGSNFETLRIAVNGDIGTARVTAQAQVGVHGLHGLVTFHGHIGTEAVSGSFPVRNPTAISGTFTVG